MNLRLLKETQTLPGTACGSKEIISSCNLLNILREVVAMKSAKSLRTKMAKLAYGVPCAVNLSVRLIITVATNVL